MSRLPTRYPMMIGGAVVAGAALFAWSGAGALTSTIDIRVEHNLVDEPDNQPRVLQATGVTAGPGFEVTVADEISNDSGWGGNVEVDVDPDAKQIIVQVEDDDCYDTVVVTIASSEITGVSTVSDDLFGDPGVTLTTSVANGVTTLSWSGTDCPSLGAVGAQAVFTYTEGGPTTTTTPTTSAPTTSTPTTQAPAVADKGAVAPAFTG